MSERDYRYVPRTLLESASENDADTEEQRIAIKSFQSLNSKINENRTSIMFFSSVVETMGNDSQEAPVVSHAKSQIEICKKNISVLNEKIDKLLESDVIQPLIQKLKDRAIESDKVNFKRIQREEYQKKIEEQRIAYLAERKALLQRLEKERTVQQEKNNSDAFNNGNDKNQEEENDISYEKANIFASIMSSVLALIGYYIIFAFGTVISAFIFRLISKIPLISSIVNYLFYLRGDNAGIVSYIIGAIISFLVVFKILSSMLKNEKTQKLAFLIAGVILIVLNGMFLIGNIAHGDAFYVNFVNIFASIGFIKVGKE